MRSQPTADAGSGKVAQAAKAADRKRTELPVMVILNTLTAQVPDNAWLDAVDYADGRLTMAGRGVSISGIIANLESSDIFSNVNFAAPTQRDREANADIFSISALVEANGGVAQ